MPATSAGACETVGRRRRDATPTGNDAHVTGLAKGLVALAFAAAALGACQIAAGGPAARPSADVAAYEGLGSWIDIFSGRVWTRPEATVSGLAAHDVGTLFLQTSNYSQATALLRPAALARFVTAAHAAGISVVAWYLPSLADPQRDYQRALAAIRFRTRDGQRFDSFALDIEASIVHDPSLRSARLLALGRRLRAAAGPDYPLGAIIPSPPGMALHPHYWPGFPYAPLARIFDVFLPMAYFSYHAHGSSQVYAYTRSAVRQIRLRAGLPDVPIHVIGGLAGGTDAASMSGFVRALADCAVSGASMYEYPHTTAGQWARLAGVNFAGAAPAADCR
jgi:hypothetical protein